MRHMLGPLGWQRAADFLLGFAAGVGLLALVFLVTKLIFGG